MALSYLFDCRFSDGSILKQTQEDSSRSIAGKNAFYDVITRLSEVERFSLIGNGKTYTVDLTDGHFECNEVPFVISTDLPEGPHDYRLIYFHRHRHMTSSGAPNSESVSFHLGWQTTINGKNFQQIIAIG